ncbi:hypothetical protein LWI28_018301 [Acer negundo]|uniref:Pyridine nucleotide-disulfide oxidoreductase domain-containing protein 2 n=1 Tax=Acer negundo TaxID=4023 RepID=A0AAD5IJR1_ACENE|nr:hypothetical protein LWI28_018301 [Acer negundo]
MLDYGIWKSRTLIWRRNFSSSSGSSSASATRTLKEKKWDALVIGGGHNGLTAAAYLDCGGLSVAVLERRHVIGGAAVTEELIPGFKFSRCSYLQSLLRPSIIRELELKKHGLKLLKPTAMSFTPCLDGRYMLFGFDEEHNYPEIAKFSKRYADAYPRYESQLHKFCKLMDFLLNSHPPETLHGDSSFKDQMKDRLQKSVFWVRCMRLIVSLGQKDMVDFVELLLSPTSKVLNKWFELLSVEWYIINSSLLLGAEKVFLPKFDDVLKVIIAGDAIIGSMASIHAPGSGYVLLHHVMGETDGDRNVWSHVEGGMGSVSLAISKAACEAGAQILTNAEVSQLMIKGSGEVNKILMADETQVHSSIVLSNATPYKTFMELVPQNVLPDDFIHAIKCTDYNSGVTKLTLALINCPNSIVASQVILRWVLNIQLLSASVLKDSACRDAWNGLPSQRPVMEMTIPSSLDKTISPPV